MFYMYNIRSIFEPCDGICDYWFSCVRSIVMHKLINKNEHYPCMGIIYTQTLPSTL